MNIFRLCIARAIIEFILGQVSGSKLAHGKVSEAHRKIWIVFLGSYDMLEVENKHYMICLEKKSVYRSHACSANVLSFL